MINRHIKQLIKIELILFISISSTAFSFGFQQEEEMADLKEMINFMVGGTWVSENAKNSGELEDFQSFFMKFEQWHDENSVKGSVYGVKNNSDTTGLMEVWNFLDYSNRKIKLIQRSTWNSFSEGNIVSYEGKHLDIQFKTIMADGRSFLTRDIHFKESDNKLRAEQFHKSKEEEEWIKAGESIWRRIRNQEYNDSQGSLSPDGEKILFVSDRQGNDDLYVINLDGTRLKQLTFDEGKDFLPHWSPDGREIVFTSGRDGDFEIYKVKSDGSGLTRLTNDTQVDEAPKWSPDGKRIAFFSLREEGNPDLYIMDSDGNNLQRITDDEGVETFPNWSPSGDYLSFTNVQLPERNPAMFMVSLKNMEWKKIYDSSEKDFGTSWVSEDRLAFYSDKSGNFEVYTVKTDGSELTQITDNAASDTFPSHIDENIILFTSNRSGLSRIYSKNLKTNEVQLIKTW